MRQFYLFGFICMLVAGSSAFAASSTDSLLQQSYEQSKAGNLDEALKTLQLAVKNDPSSSVARTRLGGIHILRQEYSKGIQDFQQAIMLDQKNASAFLGLSVAYLHMGKYNLARASLQEAGNIDPEKQTEIDNVLAWIDERTGNSFNAGVAHPQ